MAVNKVRLLLDVGTSDSPEEAFVVFFFFSATILSSP